MPVINITSFIEDAEQNDSFCLKYGYKSGTIEMTLNGETKRVKATKYSDDCFNAQGFVTRYKTGDKLWAASINYNKGLEEIVGGFNSKNQNYTKLNQVWFRTEQNEQYLSKR